MYKFFFIILSLTISLFSKEYSRIITLAPSYTKQIYLLGAQDKIIANTIFCNYPDDAKKKEKIGSLIQIDIEKILILKPDIVLASTMTKPKQIKKMRNLGINVVLMSSPRSFNDICSQFLELADYCGKFVDASKIIENVKIDVENIMKKTEKLTSKTVFMQVGAKPLFSVIRDTFVNEIITMAGGENVVTQTNTGIYSREKVIEKNPEFILIATMGIVGNDEKNKWEKYKSIEAVKQKNIYIVDSYKYLSPEPIQFASAVKGMAKILHPEIDFKE